MNGSVNHYGTLYDRVSAGVHSDVDGGGEAKALVLQTYLFLGELFGSPESWYLIFPKLAGSLYGIERFRLAIRPAAGDGQHREDRRRQQ